MFKHSQKLFYNFPVIDGYVYGICENDDLIDTSYTERIISISPAHLFYTKENLYTCSVVLTQLHLNQRIFPYLVEYDGFLIIARIKDLSYFNHTNGDFT